MSNRPIVACIFARGGSKGIPKKNLLEIDGKPLLAHAIEVAKTSFLIDRIVVSTDDAEIARVATSYGAEVPFLRPAELATDTVSSAAAIKHAVAFVEKGENTKYDYIIELMCTNPLKTVDDIDACIEKLIETDANSVIAVHKLEDHHPIRIKKIVEDHIVDFCLPEIPETRRQDLLPEAYIRSGSIYALNRDHIMVDGLRYGTGNSRPYILPPERTINIDTAIDFLVAEKLIEKLCK